MRYEPLKVANIKNTIYWCVMLCSLVEGYPTF